MDLYTCPARTHGANAPLVKHPCGVAAQALDDGTTVQGSPAIAAWAVAHSASRA